ncbi:sugar phosphate nucleotidyltransferase [Paenibacillus paridis]|uniref:sugar phosphate nucleotidyltransferase n=1 Tax=Paenibacillus paridis TaxID=2583376 RepID=UPI0011228ABB|nr:sugar phosphate nucleotidyltransferase [Paenibacillus paridis]
MKGVILAGGSGTRLAPLTRLMNKHLLPVGKYPMIYYAIRKLADAGIKDILLVIGKQSAGLYLEFLGSGHVFGVQIVYKIQDQPGGVAEALALASGFIHPNEDFVVLLGDNLFEDSLREYVEQFQSGAGEAMVLLKKVEDPERFGVPRIEEGQIISIEEKPDQPGSDYCVTGIYMYNAEVFEVIRMLLPSGRGELEITDVNNYYAARKTLQHSSLKGWWCDAGTFASLQEAGLRLANEKFD